jgi:hypothetical protein
VIARPNALDAGSDAVDDAGALIAEHHRHARVGIRPVPTIEAAVTDAAGSHAHPYFSRARLVELNILYCDRSTRCAQHRSLHEHAMPSLTGRRAVFE